MNYMKKLVTAFLFVCVCFLLSYALDITFCILLTKFELRRDELSCKLNSRDFRHFTPWYAQYYSIQLFSPHIASLASGNRRLVAAAAVAALWKPRWPLCGSRAPRLRGPM